MECNLNCFNMMFLPQVAMTREKFPEKIPFRLTRMLINAMEVTGIEGTYRKTCESVMTVLRKNKDSLMAVLEAFVYDPLLNWRLLDTADRNKRSKNIDVAGAGNVDSLGESVEDAMELLSFAGNQKQAIISKQLELLADDNAQNYLHPAEVTNKKARMIIDRVKQKLTGNDFNTTEPVDVQKQVDLLIEQATNNENLCQNYIGECDFSCSVVPLLIL
jgi:FKBP12-rapamycin complex-associated protein